eukprot:CAMPEP_0119289978 /NCGR_PEP_ID=MMETSP1329-20130426/39971_1 /TAXON_ID=114041 /ORGANISM="Genus nov. species nov., Strain RCC1024" /LENGTH=110 /DNA_ID=CAMNT_0007290793 /DNA_START=84 /DNA_END=413 /DNA_ORIENTATION=+
MASAPPAYDSLAYGAWAEKQAREALKVGDVCEVMVDGAWERGTVKEVSDSVLGLPVSRLRVVWGQCGDAWIERDDSSLLRPEPAAVVRRAFEWSQREKAEETERVEAPAA